MSEVKRYTLTRRATGSREVWEMQHAPLSGEWVSYMDVIHLRERVAKASREAEDRLWEAAQDSGLVGKPGLGVVQRAIRDIRAAVKPGEGA